MHASAPPLRPHRHLIELAATALALVTALAGCSDDASAPGSPVDDVGTVQPDIGVQFDLPNPDDDAGADVPDGAGGCIDDELEPSSITRPVEVDGSTFFNQLAICQFDDDWFEVALGDGDRLDATLWIPGAEAEPSEAEADLDLWLFDEGLDLLASAATSSSEETLVYRSGSDQTVRLRVFGEGRDESPYDLSVEITPFDDDCSADVEEPNNSAEDALEIETPFQLGARICPDDLDWYAIDAPAGSTASARLTFDHDLGDLDLRVYADGGSEPVAESNTTGDVELVELGPFEADTRLGVVVFGFRGAVNAYELAVQVLAPGNTPLTVTGAIYYMDKPFGPDGFTGDEVQRPVRGARVELVRALDGIVVGATGSDLEGWYQIDALVHDDQDYYLRAVSTLLDSGDEADFAARVEDRTEAGNLYAVAGQPFAVPESGSAQADLIAPADEPPGGAFNILDVTWGAFDFVRAHTDEIGETLTYRWEPGRAFGCGSCYRDNTVSLGGQLEDSDEYDDDIVLHEFGHYFQDNFSADDSPGGSHNGEKLDPLLAYGEGMATFFSSMVQNDPEYIDLYIDSLRLRDLETAAEVPEDFYGTADGELTGDVSEYLVSAVMWDVIDPASDDEPFDTLDRETGDVMDVFMTYMRQRDRPEIGIRGIDLADFINGLLCTFPDASEPMQTLLDEDRQYPWSTESDLACPGKARDQLDVGIERRGSELLVRGLPTETARVELVVRVDDGSGWRLDEHDCVERPCRLPVDLARPGGEGLAVVVTGRAGGRPVRASWLGERAQRRLMGDYREAESPAGPLREWRSLPSPVLPSPSDAANRR